ALAQGGAGWEHGRDPDDAGHEERPDPTGAQVERDARDDRPERADPEAGDGLQRLRGADPCGGRELGHGGRVDRGIRGDERTVDGAYRHDRGPRRKEHRAEADRDGAASERIEKRGARATHAIGQPTAYEDAGYAERE